MNNRIVQGIVILLIFLGLIFCFIVFITKNQTGNNQKIVNQNKIDKIENIQNIEKKIIYIQPLGDVKPDYLEIVRVTIESFFGYKCIIKPKIDLSNDILAASKIRYEASKILKKYKTKDYLLIITEKDIACKKGEYPEWGILGLGYNPGKTCIISTFRMKMNVTEEIVIDRLKKVALHEIGHNLGLGHCDNHPECLMNDAKGSVKQVDKEKIWLCTKCKNIIGQK